MKSEADDLFRPEALAYSREKLYGGVNAAPPVAWQIVASLIFLIFAVTLAFAFSASYSQTIRVKGVTRPEGGILQITSPRDGVVRIVHVSEGSVVDEESELVTVHVPDLLPDGFSRKDLIVESLGAQKKLILQQIEQGISAKKADISMLITRMNGLASEISDISRQIDLQNQLVISAKDDLDRAKRISERGFISDRDLRTRTEVFLSRQQQLSSLDQRRSALQADMKEISSSISKIRADSATQLATLRSQSADLDQRRISENAQGEITLVAPIGGRVTAVQAKPGKEARAGRNLLVLVPQGGALIAELHVPSAAIGFVKVKQDVNLLLDSFPHERFGTVPARIRSVSVAPIATGEDESADSSYYLVEAEILKTDIMAFGELRPLIPGMKLSANIVTDKRSFVEWLFEPIFAVRNQ
jgi:membrane fusion protein